MKKKIAFLTTNTLWGGSEVLWTQAVRQLVGQKLAARAAIYYPYDRIAFTGIGTDNVFNLAQRVRPLPLAKRLLNKANGGKYAPADGLEEWLNAEQPGLIVISQGNNVEGFDLMNTCLKLGLPYVTLTHLVVESTWPGLTDERINKLVVLYQRAAQNFFVSLHTQQMNEKMLGTAFSNCSFVHNPFVKGIPGSVPYATVANGVYRAALIGRLETFHKGYDLLFDVLKEEKWKARPVAFSVFGSGPHRQLLNRLIMNHKLENVTLYDHQEDVAEIWRTHHLLVMPSRLEGLSLTLIEAMNFKRVCVVTPVGGTYELVEDGVTGFVAKCVSAEGLDEALERSWHSRQSWEQMGEKAGERIRLLYLEDATAAFVNKLLRYL